MSDLETRVSAALNADAPPARDALFRLEVLVRLERVRFRRRVTLAVAAAAMLAAVSAPALDAWMAADVERFLGRSRAVVAIEQGWLGTLRSCRLYCCHLPPATFVSVDEGAGYFVSYLPVTPVSIECIDDPIGALEEHGAELRVLASLWPLRDNVLESSLQFSMIRMRNAQPRGHQSGF